MSRTQSDARQVILRRFLTQIGNRTHHDGTSDAKAAGVSELDNLLDSIDLDLTSPLRLDASNPADLVVSVGPAVVENTESGRKRSITHIGSLLPNDFTAGTITFPATSGNTITVSPGNNGTLTVANNEYIKVLIYMDANGNLNVLPGTPDATEANATVLPSPANTLPIGYVTLFNNAGTIDNIAQGSIFQFEASGGPSGDGSGVGINYIKNSDAELGIGDITVTANITKAEETTNPIRETTSFAFTIDTAATTADYFEFDMDDVDPFDLGKSLYVSILYWTDANYSTDDIQFVLRNIDSGVDIPIETDDKFGGKVYATGGSSNMWRITGRVPIDSADNTYTLRANVLSAPSSDSKVVIDSVIVGPDTIVPGAIIADLGTESWTDSETNATTSVRLTRMGNRLFVDGEVSVTGAFSGGSFDITIPGTYTPIINSDKPLGWARLIDTGTTSYDGLVRHGGANTLNIVSATASGAFIQGSAITPSAPFTWANTDVIRFEASWIVDGWPTGASLSTTEATMTTVKARMYLAGSQSPTTGAIKVQLDTDSFDTHNITDPTTNNDITIPRSGWYFMNGHLELSNTGEADQRIIALIYKNGSEFLSNAGSWNVTGNAGVGVTGLRYLEKGDVITLYVNHSGGGARTLTASEARTYLEIIEMPDFSTFSVFGETEDIEALGSTSPTVSNQFANVVTFELSAGEWELTGAARFRSTTTAPNDISLAISKNSGNTITDHVNSKNDIFDHIASTATDTTVVVPRHVVVLSNTQTIYLKSKFATVDGGISILSGYLSARRIK